MIETAIVGSARVRDEPRFKRKAGPAPATGKAVWQSLAGGWRQLYGEFYELGASIEWHDFELASTFAWSRCFHPESLELCLNLTGLGSIRCGRNAVDLEPLTAGFYLPGRRALRGWRASNQQHRFVTIKFSMGYLRERLAGCDGALHPLVEEFVRGNVSRAGLGEIHRLTTEQERLISHLQQPPVFHAARGLWFQSRILQLMTEFFFARRGEDELFCDRQKRTARERVTRVAALLHQRLSEPPGLEEIGKEVGCSPFYLSRTFSREMGMTIPQYLRKIRMERAAELLASRKCNVTEAAMEVGYSSLSHFSQAFCQTMGCCPALYPHTKERPGES
jgi:AraC-like DNA-binding protein